MKCITLTQDTNEVHGIHYQKPKKNWADVQAGLTSNSSEYHPKSSQKRKFCWNQVFNQTETAK
jgi:hypothetical protein